ncbi:probable inactive receptor kinase At5g10020 [Rutidosis leptorrhynchoides]|uniref:probable inactive receptor kinase At5g10020 n=1 Tax=Rutidosis leptorrhynchoides TaxID=125765 RepID=UPI003A99E90C
MQMQLHLLLLFLTAVFVAGAPAPPPATQDELRSLLEFKKGISQDPLGKITDSWNISTSDPASICPQFYGISCDELGLVTAINLDRLDLAGELKFFTLYSLKNLRNLSLSGNSFSGRIVPILGSMYSLQYLDLSSNQFYGPIPEKINDLYGLNYLNLSNNNFTGGFPNGIQNLQQLAVLDLHSNSLWGDLGVLFSELKNVQYVDLSNNQFYGSLSMDNGNVPSLVNTVQYVNLSNNKLGGGFFSGETLMLFRNLHVLDLGGNQLNGKLPSFGMLPNLEVLRLGNTQLFGPIPEELLEGSIPLKELDLSRNGFSGSIPKINSTSLTTLNLSSNELSGSLPPSLGNCQIVDLSNNLLADDISAVQKWESPIQALDLSSNKLTGNLPNLTSSFKGLTILNLGNNSLKGSVPLILLSSPSLTFLDLSTNEFDGTIPPGFFTSMTLTHLDLSNNRFTGQIPLQGSQEKSLIELSPYPPMEFLDLSQNMFTGILSSNIGNFRRLKLLNLENDGLSGELPSELTKLSQLEVLDLSNNNFKGKIPENLSPTLKFLNVSGNDLSGKVPKNLNNFPDTSFHPGNPSLTTPSGKPSTGGGLSPQSANGGKHHNGKSSIKIAIIVASVVAALMIAFVLLAYYRAQIKDFRVKTAFGGQTNLTTRDIKHGISTRPATSLSFSNTHLLTSNSRSLSGQSELGGDVVEPPVHAASSVSAIPNLIDADPTPSGRMSFDSPVASSPRFVETIEQAVTLDVYSPDRFAGQLFFFDPRPQVSFTAEDLSRAPAEILGRSSHGTLYKATLGGGQMLTVKWLRVGLTKDKKEFAKEIKKIGTMINPNVVRLIAYYWGPREQERLTLANYIEGDSLALHLYETTPRRYSLLSFSQRLKVAIDVARGLSYLHGRNMPHGNLKPTNIILEGTQYDARLTDFGLHRLMTPAGIAEQILNLGALGYRAPELASGPKPVPSLKADVYAFGVILMELLTRRSAGDIISGQSGAVDLTDWVRLCDQEGRGMDCIDRDIAGGEQQSKAMDDLLEVSLRCILPVTERPTMRQVLEDLCAISVV